MKAICLINSVDKDSLVEEEVSQPEPGPGQVLVQVCAAGVTHTELGWYPTLHTQKGDPRLRPIPGHEFSGVVSALGSGVSELSVGEAIYGLNDWFQDGATAEFCITEQSSIAPMPSRLSFAEAASVPIGALTAWQGLFDRAKLRTSERVFIQGGAGGVGIFAVQLASSRGAHVVSTALPKNFEFVRGLGAGEVIDYRTDYFSAMSGSFDVVFDVVGGDTLNKSWSLLKPGGRMVTVASQGVDQADERVKNAFFIVEPKQQQLREISDMLDSGRLRTVVDTIVPFARAAEAYTGRLAGRTGRGKVVVEVTRLAQSRSASNLS